MFLAQEHSLGKGCGLNYGIVYTTGIDNSYQYYYDPETGEQLGKTRTFFQKIKSFSEKITAF